MLNKWHRRVIPRWRDSSISEAVVGTQTGNASEKSPSLVSFEGAKVLDLLNEWRSQKSVGGAADILNFAHLPGILPLLREPAEYLVSLKEPSSPLLKQISLNVLKGEGFSHSMLQSGPPLAPREWHFYQASRLKKSIFTNPRNAVALIDLARIYATLGQNKKAKKAVITAVTLYPNHRFILRSAARFFIQTDESDRALDLINNSSRTLTDPWLLATKLSIEEILGRHHRQIKIAHSMVESEGFTPSQLSELRGTIASIQFASGENKPAKRMFNKALINPNDNVVAQAMWTSKEYSVSIDVRSEWFTDPLSSEALFYHKQLEGDFECAIEAATSWFFDEPFSPRPLKAAAFVSGILGDAELSEKYARDGLLLDKDDIELRNNLVCALASQNKIKEALEHLHQILHLEQSQNKEIGPHTIANCGMICYREGRFDEGEEYYRNAINIFNKKKYNASKGIAIAFMAREAVLTGAPNAHALVTEATDIVAKFKSKEGAKILSLIDQTRAQGENSTSDRSQMTPRWAYDKARNILTVKKGRPFR